MNRPLRIGVTLGDVNGIGPEVAVRAVSRRWPAGVRLVLIGCRAVASAQAEALGLPPPTAWDPSRPGPARKVSLWDPEPSGSLSLRPGRVSAAAGRAAAGWVESAVKACRNGLLDGIVTAPIHKEGFHRAGIRVPGHTELLASLCGSPRVGMMLMGRGLRVMLATRHVPLAEVPTVLTRPVLREAIRLTAQALRWMGQEGPIAVCGLNPHAGDGGVLGREEIDWIRPTIRAEQRRGMPVEGPVPADTVFAQAVQGQWAAVVAMYHDQGLAPLKLLAFDEGVNVTLGLPVVRTSPDHGTAYAIAGQGVANPSSMVEAVRAAIHLAGRPNPWRPTS